jgi:hypothetical protein
MIYKKFGDVVMLDDDLTALRRTYLQHGEFHYHSN